ncbi:MAG: hypothetical protein MZV63_20930 [Marinilabiliales bacterium]|nr:hypothetical protein [Marinilabiliales bacterium]
MVLNMITTTLMIKLGRVKGNKMVNMQLTNKKLIEQRHEDDCGGTQYPERSCPYSAHGARDRSKKPWSFTGSIINNLHDREN